MERKCQIGNNVVWKGAPYIGGRKGGVPCIGTLCPYRWHLNLFWHEYAPFRQRKSMGKYECPIKGISEKGEDISLYRTKNLGEKGISCPQCC